jgi:hypothetical protein
MEAVGAPRSYARRATGPLIDARCWSAWVIAAGQTQGLILCRCRRRDRGSSVRSILGLCALGFETRRIFGLHVSSSLNFENLLCVGRYWVCICDSVGSLLYWLS